MGMGTKKINSIIMSMWDNIFRVLNMEKEGWCILTVVYMLDSLKTKCLMEWVILNIQTKTNILDNSLREKNMERATTFLVKELYSVVYGRMIKNYKASWLFSMEMFLMVASKTTNVIKANTDTEMVIFMMERGEMM